MKRVSSFLLGVIVGAVGLYLTMTYHVVRAQDGVHLVRKVPSGWGDTYVDIREFRAAEWNEHKNLVAALIHANQEDLLQDSAMSDLRHSAREILDSLGR